jgi:hypothetical protein
MFMQKLFVCDCHSIMWLVTRRNVLITLPSSGRGIVPQATAAKEIAEAKAAEDEIKKQAAELERLMKELDMSDSEDEE